MKETNAIIIGRHKNQGSTLCKLGVLIASQEVEENIGAKDDVSTTSRRTQALKRVVKYFEKGEEINVYFSYKDLKSTLEKEFLSSINYYFRFKKFLYEKIFFLDYHFVNQINEFYDNIEHNLYTLRYITLN